MGGEHQFGGGEDGVVNEPLKPGTEETTEEVEETEEEDEEEGAD